MLDDCKIHGSVCSPCSVLCCVLCALCSVLCAPCSVLCALCSVLRALCSVLCAQLCALCCSFATSHLTVRRHRREASHVSPGRDKGSLTWERALRRLWSFGCVPQLFIAQTICATPGREKGEEGDIGRLVGFSRLTCLAFLSPNVKVSLTPRAEY